MRFEVNSKRISLPLKLGYRLVKSCSVERSFHLPITNLAFVCLGLVDQERFNSWARVGDLHDVFVDLFEFFVGGVEMIDGRPEA